MSASLPASPSLEQLRKQAKDLLRAHRAATRSRRASPPASAAGGAADAQRGAARDRARARVPKLAAATGLRRPPGRHGPDLQHAYHEDLDYYDAAPTGCWPRPRTGPTGAVAAFARHDAPLTRGARDRHRARARLSRRGRRCGATSRACATPGSRSRAPTARSRRTTSTAAGAARPLPGAGAARGTNGNDLLGMAGATCDERLVAILLERGADVARANAHGWTPLHQAAYSDLPAMARMLLDAGAPVGRLGPRRRRHAAGRRPVLGQPQDRRAARRARRAAAQPARRGRARADRPDRRAGRRPRHLAPEAGAHRAFYRPHSGFPAWQPSDDRRSPRRGAVVGGAQRPRRGARGARRPRRRRSRPTSTAAPR